MAGALVDRQHLPRLDDSEPGLDDSEPSSRRALYEEAQRRKIPGRSKMSRAELAAAVGHD
jgi:hypothetical protein